MATLFSDFLTQLKVKHTDDYSDHRFLTMPFQTMFGLVKLLQEYHIDAKGIKFSDKSLIRNLHTPFLADTPEGFTIVQRIDGNTVSYLSQSKEESADFSHFVDAWNGVALVAETSKSSVEPDYARHHLDEVFNVVKCKALWVLGILLAAFLIWKTGLYESISSMAVAVLSAVGVYISFMLVQKSLNIKNVKADAVCSVLQEGGCDTIAKSEASSFLGIVKWSEVGLAYFSVTLIAILLFPAALKPWLAVCNILCLPYTVWSITFQKFVAKTWCTLCVTVQILLWALFIAFSLGGWWHDVTPLRSVLFAPSSLGNFAALVAVYGVALLAINRFDNALSRLLRPNNLLSNDSLNNSDYGKSDSIK